VSKNSDIS
jgi:hypothetical protein